MTDRIKILFVPFIISLIALAAGYTFLHWLLSPVIALKDWLWLFVFPIALTALPVFFHIVPKLKILKLEKQNSTRDWKDFYGFMLFVCLAVPAVIAQHYMVTATGKLTEINTLSEINNHKPTKYYKIQNYYVFKNYAFSNKFSVQSRGRHSVQYDLKMDIYFAFPLFDSAEAVFSPQLPKPPAWLGRHFSDKIDNDLSDEEKEIEYDNFVKRSIDKMNAEDFSGFSYFDKIGLSENYDGFQDAIKGHFLHSKEKNTVFESSRQPFEQRNGSKQMWLIITAAAGIFIWLIMISIPKINKSELKRIRDGKPDTKTIKARKEFLKFITPQKNFWATHLLAYSNLAVYLIMVFAGLGVFYFDGKDLLAWGGLYAPLVKDGQVWRLLTSVFLHGGLMHIANNMFGLVIVGVFLESKTGSWKFLISYLISGIFAGIASMWWRGAGGGIGVGASGAIFGMYGLLLALLLTKKYDRSNAGGIFIFAGINIAVSLLMGMFGNIDNAAHIGGLISGFALGLCLSPAIKIKRVRYKN